MSDQDPGLTGADLPPLDPDLAAWFAASPSPTMPPQVWSRIEGALAAEPPFAAETPLAAAAAPAGNVVDLSERRERRGLARAWPVLAGAAGVVLVGAVVLPAMRAGNAPAPVADAPVGAGASAESPTPLTGSKSLEGGTPVSMPRVMLASGTDYSKEAMPQQVGELLTSAGIPDARTVADMASAEPQQPVAPADATGMASSPETLADCLSRLGLVSVPNLIVDSAFYEGRDVSVIVAVESMGEETDPAMLDVVVVGSECTDTDVAGAEHFAYAVAP